MSWTDERVELLSQLWLEGKSASMISAALGAGLTRNAVIGKVHRLGLAGRAKPPTGQSVDPAPMRATAPPTARRATGAGAIASSTAAAMSPRTVAASGPMAGAAMMQGNAALAMAPEAAPQAQPERIAAEIVVPMSLRVTIVDLKESMCKWPLGDPTSSDFRYCGSPAHGTTPYCQHHGKLAYQPVQDRRREREREKRALLLR